MPRDTPADTRTVRTTALVMAVCASIMAAPVHPALGLSWTAALALVVLYAGCVTLAGRMPRHAESLLVFGACAHALLFVLGAGEASLPFAPVLAAPMVVAAIARRPMSMWLAGAGQMMVLTVGLVVVVGPDASILPFAATSLWLAAVGWGLRGMQPPSVEAPAVPTLQPSVVSDLPVASSLPPTEGVCAHTALMESAALQKSARAFHHMMGTILTSAQIVRDELKDAGQVDEDLDFLVRKANEASDMALRLLSVTRNDTTDSGSLDLSEVLRRVLPDIEAIVGPHARVELQVLPGLPSVHMDVGHLDEALFELVRNAAEAMGPAGHLRIAAFVDSSVPAGCVRIAVEDNGPGFAGSVARHAFDPYFSTRDRGDSCGLGLTLVQSIVRRCGGRAHIDPDCQRGARVVLDLPVVPAEEGMGLSGGVVVVGRNDGDSRVVASLLRDSGYSVRFAEDGTQALQALSVADGSAELVVLEESEDNLRLANLIARDWSHLDVVWLGRRSPELSPAIQVLHNVPVYAVVDALKRITLAA